MKENLIHKDIKGSFFPPEEHRISIIQIDVSLTSNNNVPPFSIKDSDEHIDKITKALSSALQDNWSNILVFPEVSIQEKSLITLMNRSWEIMKSRPKEVGAAIVCLPLEHISLTTFGKLLANLSACERFKSGDSSLTPENFIGHLFERVPPTELNDAFVNVAILLVFGQSGSKEQGLYFIQPKRYPYPQENTPQGGKFVHGARNYLLEISGTKVMTVICYDMIAQAERSGLFLSKLTRECFDNSVGLDYLLVPQCNEKPLDSNFQHALAQLYHDFQSYSQTLRTVSPNVAHKFVNGEYSKCGHSWLVTSLFGKEPPLIGIWERTLPSVFKAYPDETCREVSSLGHFAQRLRLSATGEWMLHLTVPDAQQLLRGKGSNIALPAHRGEIWQWNDNKWEKKDPSIFMRDCYYSERLPGLKVLTELPSWIRENMGGKSTYSPSFDEFANGIVHLPDIKKKTVLSSLEGFRDVYVKGAPASGKTVFGLGVALDWIKQSNGRSLFFDLKDLDFDSNQFTEIAKEDIKWFLDSIQENLLIVIDNVHTQEAEACKLLRYIQELRGSGYRVQVLLLGHLKGKQPTERKGLVDIGDLVTVDLIANEEAFMCVARRLLQKSNNSYEMNPDIVSKWVKECGGDLAVFVISFDPSNPEILNQSSSSTQVRNSYIIPVEKQGRKDLFITLCVLSVIDLNVDDQAIWNASAEALFPEFVENSTLLRTIVREENPRQYWRLFHPSLGKIVLTVLTDFSKPHFKKMWLEYAIKVCQSTPFFLLPIHYRLSTGNYGDIINFKEWCTAINSCDGLVELALCNAPHYTSVAIRRGGLNWSWKRLVNLPRDKGYDNLLNNLAQTPAHFVAAFLKYLDERGLTKERENLLDELLKNDEFKNRLARTPSNCVAAFFKCLDECALTKKRENLLDELLKNDEFKNRLARTPAGDVAAFLKYLDACKLLEERKTLLVELLEDDEFKSRLARTYADHVAALLNCLDECDLTEERTTLLDELLEKDEFKKTLSLSPLDAQGSFFGYLSTHHDKNIAQDLLSRYWGSISPTDFEAKISVWPHDQIRGFRSNIINTGLNLPKMLWEPLTRAAVGKTWKPPFPDPEYPQNQLLNMPVSELTRLLTHFDRIRYRFKMNCIMKSLISNEEKLGEWVSQLSQEDTAMFRDTVTKLRVKIPPNVWELLLAHCSKMAKAYLGIGSNLGDKEKNLRGCIEKIKTLRDIKLLCASGFYENEPVGGPPQSCYLNAAVAIETSLSPQELLKILQEVEASFGRVRDVKWGARTLDIDILLYDDEIVSDDDLIIPHTLMHERLFVLKPLSEIAGDVKHPTLNKTIGELMHDMV